MKLWKSSTRHTFLPNYFFRSHSKLLSKKTLFFSVKTLKGAKTFSRRVTQHHLSRALTPAQVKHSVVMRTNKSRSIFWLFTAQQKTHKTFFFIFLFLVQIIFTNKVFFPSFYIFFSNFELYIFVRLVLRTYYSFARLLPYWLREGREGVWDSPETPPLSVLLTFSLSLSLSLSFFSFSLFLQRKGESGVRSGNREEKRKHIFLSFFLFLSFSVFRSLSHFSHSYSPCLRYYSLI